VSTKRSQDRVIWRLKAGMDRRFRAGHPWVYSNELQGSPKGIQPGDPIELHDAGGKFLARGYGSPVSLIAFRALSRDPDFTEPASPAGLHRTLARAAHLRESLGLAYASHRLCFGEADGLPGLVVDRYRLSGGSDVLVAQAHTAGAERMLGALPESLATLLGPAWSKARLLVRNDLSVRKLEGLEVEERARALHGTEKGLEESELLIAPVRGSEPTRMLADLASGQKTGFFLDQSANVRLAAERLAPALGTRVRVLDLCCYVGQWSTQLTRHLKALSPQVRVEVTAFDSSARALELARQNISGAGADCKTTKGDVLEDLAALEPGYDVVICDPPALIKGRKDAPQGKHAYLQLNTQALRLVKPGGFIVTCSCSGLLEEEDFLSAIGKAARRNSADLRLIARGAQAPDHPMLPEFPEGRYLKCWIGAVLPKP
jgi:23S rRNA (cytosine1962-C5)-methyltransferase